MLSWLHYSRRVAGALALVGAPVLAFSNQQSVDAQVVQDAADALAAQADRIPHKGIAFLHGVRKQLQAPRSSLPARS